MSRKVVGVLGSLDTMTSGPKLQLYSKPAAVLSVCINWWCTIKSLAELRAAAIGQE